MTVSNEAEAALRPAAVYRLYDATGALLYIGSAYDPEERCKAHRDKPWWPQVVRRTEEWYPHRGRAYAEEMKAIAAESSKHNQMGSPGYTTPQTEAVRRRKALAKTRGKLISESGMVRNDIRDAALEAGFPSREARRMATLAGIEFLDWTTLFPAAVKWRREQLERYGH